MAERIVTIIVKAVDQTAGALGSANKNFQGLQQTLAGVGRTMTLGVTAPIVAGAVAAVDAGMDYETAFAGVLKTTDGLGESVRSLTEDGQMLYDGLREMALVVPFTPEQLASIAEAGGQIGIAKENMLDYTRTIADMSIATGMTVDEVALDMARFGAIMAVPQEDIDNMGASIVDLGNKFASTEPEILNMALRMAGLGRVVGLSAQEVLGWSNAAASVGVRTEMGGSAISRFGMYMATAMQNATGGVVDNTEAIGKQTEKLSDLREALAVAQQKTTEWTDKTKESTKMADQFRVDNLIEQVAAAEDELAALNELQGQTFTPEMAQTWADVAGMSVADFAGMVEEDASGAMLAFVTGLGKMRDEGGDVIGTLDKLGLSEIRVRDTLLRLAGAPEMVASSLRDADTAWDENIALTKEAERRYATSESQMGLLKNALNDFGITMGNVLMPALLPLIQGLTEFVKGLSKMDEGTLKTIIQIGLFAAAIGPLFLVLSGLAGLLGFLVSPIGLIVLGVAALVAAFVAANGGIGPTIEMLKELWSTLAEKLSPALTTLQNLWNTVWPSIQTVIQTVLGDVVPFISTLLGDLFGWLIERIGWIAGWIDENSLLIQTTIETVMGAILAVWNFVWPIFEEVVTRIWGAMSAIISGAIEFIFGIIKGVMEAINGDWDEAWKTIKEAGLGYVTALWEGLDILFGDLVEGIVEWIKGLWEDVEQWFHDIWESITGWFQKVYDDLIGASLIPDLVDDVLGAIEGLWNDIEEWFHDIWQSITDWIGKAVDDVVGPEGLIPTMISSVTGRVEQFIKDIGEAFGKVKDIITKPFRDAKEFLSKLHIPVPHINVSWSSGPLGIQIPKFGVKWYGSGLDAIFNQPTLIGVGERGAERVSVTPLGREGGRSGGSGDTYHITVMAASGQAEDTVARMHDLMRLMQMGTAMP